MFKKKTSENCEDERIERTEPIENSSDNNTEKEDSERAKIAEDIKNRLFSDINIIKENKEPEFDFYKLYNEDEGFRNDFNETASAMYAYMNYCAKNSAEESKAKAKSFIEAGAEPSAATGRIKTSPANMSDKDFSEYIRKILGE